MAMDSPKFGLFCFYVYELCKLLSACCNQTKQLNFSIFVHDFVFRGGLLSFCSKETKRKLNSCTRNFLDPIFFRDLAKSKDSKSLTFSFRKSRPKNKLEGHKFVPDMRLVH